MPIQKNEMRNDPRRAEQILNEVFPNAKDRDLILAQLWESIRQCESVVPNAWAVTLHLCGFRLNVGKTEALAALNGKITVLMREYRGADLGGRIGNSPYKSVPGKNSIYYGTTEQFRADRKALVEAHYDYISAAGTTKSGAPMKGTRFRSSHSPGLVKLAKSSGRFTSSTTLDGTS